MFGLRRIYAVKDKGRLKELGYAGGGMELIQLEMK